MVMVNRELVGAWCLQPLPSDYCLPLMPKCFELHRLCSQLVRFEQQEDYSAFALKEVRDSCYRFSAALYFQLPRKENLVLMLLF